MRAGIRVSNSHLLLHLFASCSPGNMLLLPQAVIFCFYCDRVFSDESTLITHQKARHFK